MFRSTSVPCSESFETATDHGGPIRDNFHTLTHAISNYDYSCPTMSGSQLPELRRAQTRDTRYGGCYPEKNQSQSATLSSHFISEGARDPSPKENLGFSRWTLNRLGASHASRPESAHGLGSIFSRSTRKEKKDRYTGHVSRASTSNISTRGIDIVVTQKDCEDKAGPNVISVPYNFRHIRHTKQASHSTNKVQTGLVSECPKPSYIHNQADSKHQNLKVNDLHFENFSSEALGTSIYEENRLITAAEGFHSQQKTVLHQTKKPLESDNAVYTYVPSRLKIPSYQSKSLPQSRVNLMNTLPARKSSRSLSVIDPVILNSLDELEPRSELKIPFPISVPTPTKSNHSEHTNHSLNEVSEKNDTESWPLPSSINSSSSFGLELADVEEEEEDLLSEMAHSMELISDQKSFDFDEQLLGSSADGDCISENGIVTTWDTLEMKGNSGTGRSPKIITKVDTDSWESDIDWCYENEVEADCNYRWIEDETLDFRAESFPIPNNVKASQLQTLGFEFTSGGNFRPSLLLPVRSSSPPGLSPLSAAFTTSPPPRTPVNLTQGKFSSKHGNISSINDPNYIDDQLTNITANDFQTSVNYSRDNFAAISPPRSYNSSISSSIDSGSDSTQSTCWSLSHSSARSFSSTRTSDSMNNQEQKLHRRAASINYNHQNCKNVPQSQIMHTQNEYEILAKMAAFNFSRDTANPPLIDRRSKTLCFDARLQLNLSHSFPAHLSNHSSDSLGVGRAPNSRGRLTTRSQPERKLSAPTLNQSSSQSYNTAMPQKKTRSASAARVKCSYGLFPKT